MTNRGSSKKPSGWRGLSETSKIALTVAGITGVLGIVAAIIGALIAHSGSNNPTPPGASSPTTTLSVPTYGPSGGGSSPASPTASGSPVGTAYTMTYQNKSVVIQTASDGSCGFGELVNIDKPSVDPSQTSGDSFGVTSTDCTNWSFQAQLYNGASGNKPLPSSQLQDSPSACLSAISTDPNPQDDPAVAGYSFCVESTDGHLAYVKIISVDSQGDVTLRLDGWSTD